MIKLLSIVVLILTGSCVPFAEELDSPGPTAPIGEDHGQYHHYVNAPLPTWGEGQKVWQYRNYYFAGTPNSQTFLHAKAAGVSVTIDLRPEKEIIAGNSDNSQISAIKIISLPVTKEALFNQDVLIKFSKIIESIESANAPDEPPKDPHEKQAATSIMILHSSPNEAAALFVAYLSDHSSLNQETCISIAHSIGLNDQELELKLKKYLSRG